ncbi:hypothetical protein RM533_13580 [Croceicoccus sp. F390]|uniref:Uncharacterized protein n=1 Tax=Croceicoccus esteveae TaxID=3075597 RepID=A0ABU2ZLE1_9SPHN|nr:hypothetical protein [Croceicoccus sp. F390]MDT0577186.1 hypothetical protein [Croceicoccus sp. F390]
MVSVALQYATAPGKNATCQALVSVKLAAGAVPLMLSLRVAPAGKLDGQCHAHGQGRRACALAGVPDQALDRERGVTAAGVRSAVCWPLPVTGQLQAN